jgi:hypothetical protein
LKRKLLLLALLVVAFCLITPTVSANAQVNREKQTAAFTDSYTVIEDLEPSDYPYTQMKVDVTVKGEFSYMYSQVMDAKGHLHINGKASSRGTMQSEAWLFDDVRQIWILGQQQTQSQKMFVSLNELTLDSETRTSQEISIITSRMKISTLDLETGQTVTVDVLIIEHLMFKLNNDELLFHKSWDIVHN